MKTIIEIIFFFTFLMSCAAVKIRSQPAESERSQSSKPEEGMPKTEPIVSNKMAVSSANIQNLTGEWQGTINNETESYRIVLKIIKETECIWRAIAYVVDEEYSDGFAADSVSVRKSEFEIEFNFFKIKYKGKINADGSALQGKWSEDSLPTVNATLKRVTKADAWLRPTYKTKFIAVDKNVQLEVLDWGGSGRPLVFLAGRGGTAHSFEKFAPKFVPKYHVYGITRRGFGQSSIPYSGYSSDRLADDVLAVITALNLKKPVLVGHSAGGGELSSIGSRYPEKVAGLIYLDALNHYSYYDQIHGSLAIDMLEVKRKLEQYHLETLLYGAGPQREQQIIIDLLKDLKRLKKLLRERQKELGFVPLLKEVANKQPELPESLPDNEQAAPSTPAVNPYKEITMGIQKYSDIRAPILAICAFPWELSADVTNTPTRRALLDIDNKHQRNRLVAFQKRFPKAHVVKIANASHWIWRSHESDVLREMNAFLDSLEGS